MSGDDDLSHLSLLELYREETRTQTQALTKDSTRPTPNIGMSWLLSSARSFQRL